MEGMIGIQWIIFIGIAVVSWLVQMNLQNKFKKYSKIPTAIPIKIIHCIPIIPSIIFFCF